MSDQPLETLAAIFSDAVAAHTRFASDGLASVATAAEAVSRALRAGHKVLAFGNGGSASDAEHLVAELVGRFEAERRPLNAIALSANSSVTTAIANDDGYERVFARQIEGLGSAGDVALAISTSGRSRNVELALTAAKARGMVTIALTGRDGGRIGAEADVHVNVPATSTARIQEVHRTILHAICSLVERSLASSASGHTST